MRIHPALGLTSIVWLWFSSLSTYAAEVPPQKQSLAIPLAAAGRPAGSVECLVTRGSTLPLAALAFSPDGKTLAVGGYEEVLLWDLGGAKLAKRIATAGQVGAVAFLKDGKTLVVGTGTPSSSGAVVALDVATGKEAFRFAGPTDVVHSLALSPDGKFLAASGPYEPVHVWNLDEKKLATTIQEHHGWVLNVSFSANGKFLATAGDDNTARIWEVGSWKPVIVFADVQPVRGAAFHTDEIQVLLAVGGPNECGLRLRRMDKPPSRRMYGTGVAMPLGLVGPTQANSVYVPCTDKTVKVFDITNGRLLANLSGHQDWVYAVAISSDETRLASGSADGTVKLWATKDNRLLATLVQLAPRTDEWLVMTTEGYFATSSPGALAWKAENLSTPPDELRKQLQSPESVGKAIAGEKIAPPTLK
ncbi:MAG: WD40 repeat domain-containing protein [Planctomycetota bacterium]|nr:WD40 repeat domain-containing protein [Planctomycetota bacterium]